MTYNDKGGGGPKLLEKLVTSLMDGPYLNMLLLLVMYGTVSDYLFFFSPVTPWSQRLQLFLEVADSTPISEYFFKKFLAPLMNFICFKIILVFVVIGMWIFCGLSIFDLREGLERHRIARSNSHVGEFLHYEDLAFRRLNYRIHMVIHGFVDYR